MENSVATFALSVLLGATAAAAFFAYIKGREYAAIGYLLAFSALYAAGGVK